MAATPTAAYVRTEDAPLLPPPPATTGVIGWLRANLFPNPLNTTLTVVAGALIVMVIWHVADWALFRAVWQGANREACTGETTGACWPFVWDKFPQWIYGFYPIDQRWRPNIVYLTGIAALVPMLIPWVRHKLWNALFLLIVYPLLTLILLTGGHFDFGYTGYAVAIGVLLAAASALPIAVFGLESGVAHNRGGLVLAGLGLLPLIAAFAMKVIAAVVSFAGEVLGLIGAAPVADLAKAAAASLVAWQGGIFDIPYVGPAMGGLLLVAAVASVLLLTRRGGRNGIGAIKGWLIGGAAILLAMAILGFDFGLTPVETSQWGGLLVTLVTSVTGIVASLPIGILLALGRRARMPVVRAVCVGFIEMVRGVPLITVLFMSSVMLPLFLPPGVNFDKLLRVLIGIALFSAAYMAEVVRAGLQAIARGQYEGAMALGLSYWQMMGKVVLPQALKITIPTIVGSFISLFKDTTLVGVVGIYDLLLIVSAGFSDPKWVSPHAGATGYFTAAMVFWIFCFSMSRYAIFIERRLNTGRKR